MRAALLAWCALAGCRTPHRESSPEGRASPVVEDAVCTDMVCDVFPDERAAFASVLAEGPHILGIGEAHASFDAGSASVTVRFRDELLPLLRGRATDLIVEIWVANGKCGRLERDVQARQAPVVAREATTNPSDFVALGNAAYALGIKPHVLVPNCDEYARIVAAGERDIDEMLKTITRRSYEAALRHLPDADGGTLLLYGGAMHNDLSPRAGREEWSFGPALSERVQGRYIELDIIAPEMIQDTDVWRALPWYGRFRRDRQGARAVLLRPAPRSYVLVLPPSR